MIILPLLATLSVVAAAEERPTWEPEHPVYEYTPARQGYRYRTSPPHGGWHDPVEPLTETEAAALTKPTAAVWKGFLDGYEDRIAAHHAAAVPPELKTFLDAQPALRQELWRVPDPRFDDVAAFLTVFDGLRRRAKDPASFLAHRHLALAIAAVHDQPNLVASARFFTLWSVDPQQFSATMTPEAIYDWFADPGGPFRFRAKDLAWPLMVHQVDVSASAEDLRWVRQKYQARGLDLQEIYASVPYDNDKLAKKPPRLGDRPYTLPNLLAWGGVCVDQAHFSSQVAKALGIPALKCGGEGRYGGVGHAWTGYLAVGKGGAPQLEFTGRYQDDFYYLGQAYDPQTGRLTTDREVELFYDAVSGRYETWSDASLLTRAARALLQRGRMAEAALIAREAVNRDPCIGEAWRVLVSALPPKDIDSAWKILADHVGRHPDLVWEVLKLGLLRQSVTVGDKSDCERRRLLFERCATVAAANKRNDLLIDIRSAQCAVLDGAGRSQEAITIAFECVRANVREGALVLPLVRRVVEMANGFRKRDPGFRIEVVRSTLKSLSADFPRTRGEEITPAWREWVEITSQLAQ